MLKRAAHGDRVWAVYLVVSREQDDPRHVAAADDMVRAGYEEFGGPRVPAGELGCDFGSYEALDAAGVRLDPQWRYYATAAYFATDAHAKRFVDAYEPGVVGRVQVTWGCAD